MSQSKIKLPGTVGPWFTYWLEYVSDEKLGLDQKNWFRKAIQEILRGNEFARRPLDSISNYELDEFLRIHVEPKFTKPEFTLLSLYFLSAMFAAKKLGGAAAFEVAKSKSGFQRIFSKTLLAFGLVIGLVVVGFGVLSLERMVNKHEDVLTASATVLRENGLGVVVAAFEDIYYEYIQPPKVGGEPALGPNADDSGEVSKFGNLLIAKIANNPNWGVAQQPSVLPEALLSPVTPQPGEGTWKPTKVVVNDNTAIWIARIRPDNIHTSYWATVTWFDPKLLAFAQVPGTKVPEVSGLPDRTGLVPPDLKPFYMAGLNGGFLMRDSQGGYQFGDVTYKKLVRGKASLVTYADGSLDVVNWGRDQVKGNVQSIRQNLELIVDGGVSQVQSENQSKWGWVWHGVGSGKNLVWRSAIGVRADGTVVSVLGSKMSAGSLADVLVRAGAQRAIILDMNASYANGYLYGPYVGGKPLASETSIPSDRFWLPSERDFIAVYAKSPAAKAD